MHAQARAACAVVPAPACRPLARKQSKLLLQALTDQARLAEKRSARPTTSARGPRRAPRASRSLRRIIVASALIAGCTTLWERGHARMACSSRARPGIVNPSYERNDSLELAPCTLTNNQPVFKTGFIRRREARGGNAGSRSVSQAKTPSCRRPDLQPSKLGRSLTIHPAGTPRRHSWCPIAGDGRPPGTRRQSHPCPAREAERRPDCGGHSVRRDEGSNGDAGVDGIRCCRVVVAR